MIKAVALRDGLPPWLVYRNLGLALNKKIGMSFDNYPEARRLFYEPIFAGTAGAGPSFDLIRPASPGSGFRGPQPHLPLIPHTLSHGAYNG